MKKYKIAVIPGDGIGIEVMEEGLKVLKTVSEMTDKISFEFTNFDWGCEYYLKNGVMMEDDGLKKLEQFDGILLGAVGFPGVPDDISLRGLLLKIRQGFNQYINLRPIKLLPNIVCPISGKAQEDIDFIFVRENTEGEYSGIGGFFSQNTPNESAVQTSLFTRNVTEKTMDYAFQLSQKRKKYNKVTSVTKSNALNYGMVFWDKIFNEVSSRYNDIKTESFHVDAMTMYMIQSPENFDVIVASNLFGDILTDLGAVLQGGLGFAAGANINPEKKYPSMFEPVHGSAPSIAGKGISNPIAMIWSCKMMLDHLGHYDLGDKVMESIIETVKDRNLLTKDLGGNGTTSSVGNLICKNLKKFLE